MQVAEVGMGKGRLVKVNDRGLRVGEDHQHAKLTDHEVELMRHLHEVDKVGYRRLAKMFDLSKTTVRNICNYRWRCQTVVGFRKV